MRHNVTRRNRVFVVLPQPVEPKPWTVGSRHHNGVKTLHDDGQQSSYNIKKFLGMTTIPGLTQIYGSDTVLGKLIWMALFITGIAMAIYQSGNLIAEYRKYPVVERSFREVQWTIAFPSVTVCLNNPTRWANFSDVSGRMFTKSVTRRLKNITGSRMTHYTTEESLEEIIALEELSVFTEEERLGLGIPPKMFIILCIWDEQTCTLDPIYFNNLYFGNCFTYNPGLIRDTQLRSGRMQSLHMVLRSQFDDLYPYTRRDSGLVMAIHQPGTAPVIDSRRAFQLYPGRWLSIGVTKTRFKRLPPPYSSECVDSFQQSVRESTMYYTDDRPYVYSLDACTESCIQRLSIEFCQCFIPTAPVPPNSPKRMCPQHKCDAIKRTDSHYLCGCKKACMSDEYDVRVDIDDRWLEQEVWQTWVKEAIDSNNESINIFDVSGFEIFAASTIYEKIKEEPKILLADFLGAIGGNLGLWVGISVISIIEMLEFFVAVLLYGTNVLMKRVLGTDCVK